MCSARGIGRNYGTGSPERMKVVVVQRSCKTCGKRRPTQVGGRCPPPHLQNRARWPRPGFIATTGVRQADVVVRGHGLRWWLAWAYCRISHTGDARTGNYRKPRRHTVAESDECWRPPHDRSDPLPGSQPTASGIRERPALASAKVERNKSKIVTPGAATPFGTRRRARDGGAIAASASAALVY